MFRFFQNMIQLRKNHPSIWRPEFWRSDVKWYGVDNNVDMGDSSHTLAYRLHGASQNDADLYVMINAYWEQRNFTINEGTEDQWKGIIDTGKPSPDDIIDETAAQPLHTLFSTVQARSVVVLTRRSATH